MSKAIIPVVLFFITASFIYPQTDKATEQLVFSQDVKYRIRLPDGDYRIVTVRYEAKINSLVTVTGKTASIFHPIDTRNFALTVEGLVNRTIFISEGIEQREIPQLTNTFEVTSLSNVIQNFGIFTKQDRSQSLLDAENVQSAAANQTLLSEFPGIIASDEAAIRSEIVRLYAATEIIKL